MTTGIFTALGAVLVLILLDTLLGIILSIKASTFDIRKLPQFLVTNLLPYVGGLMVLALATYVAGDYSTQLASIFFATATATAAKFIAEIKDKAAQIFGKVKFESFESAVNINDLNDTLIIQIREAVIEALQKQTTRQEQTIR